MSLSINHNIASINAQRNVTNNSMDLNKALERLSSGLRINRASDDAAGLVISEQMRSQITGLNQAVSNSETATSMVQTSEGALDEVNKLLNKARTLALHSANEGANDGNQLAADQNELDNVIKTINRISDVTQFGTKKLLDGSLNGATSLGAGVNRVNVGNLANNSAVAAGSMSLNVTGYIKEANTLTLGTGDASSGYVFDAAVSGMNVGSAHLRSGSQAKVTVNGIDYAYVATGAISATGVADALTSAITAASGGYTVSYDSANGGYKVRHEAPGGTDFTAALVFSRTATAAITGTDESSTAQVTITSGATDLTVAAVYFNGITGVENVTSTTVVTTGSTYTATLGTATGTVSYTYTVITGDTMNSVITAVQSGIRALVFSGVGSFTGATVTLGSGIANGFNVKLSRGNDAVTNDFNFNLTSDFANQSGSVSAIHSATLSGVAAYTGTNHTFDDGAGSGLANLATTGQGAVTKLGSGSAIILNLNGDSFSVVAGAGGTTLSGVETALGTHFTGYTVLFASAGASLTGAAFAMGSGSVSTGAGFYVVKTDGTAFTMSLKVDQAVGSDISAANATVQASSNGGAAGDLITYTQTKITGVGTISGTAAVSIVNATSGTINTSGAQGTGTLTTSSGLALALVQTNLTASGAGTYSLTTGAQDLGFKEFVMELTTGLSEAGGTTSFALNDGAKFQIGANAGQYAGVTIDSVAASELGRNVVGSGTIKSLNDMLSSEQSALTTGKSDQALKVIDAAVDQVTNLRGKLGGFQSNTLESGLNSLRVSSENLTAAESTIRDTDFAAESAEFTRTQILVQASTSMLAQANQLPQNVLSLLRS